VIPTAISDLILSRLGDCDLVLDVGGARYPWFRDDWVLDRRPFERMVGPVAFAGRDGETPRFSRDTWLVRDFYDLPWPFPDKHFDFSLCMGTLEDIRDPLVIALEIQRVSRAGYISMPTRATECARGISEHPASCDLLGYFHHRWLVEIDDAGLTFTAKGPLLYQHRQWIISDPGPHTLHFFWQDSFPVHERNVNGHDDALGDLARFHAAHQMWRKAGSDDAQWLHWPEAWGPRPHLELPDAIPAVAARA
jgi:hypothetical protein